MFNAIECFVKMQLTDCKFTVKIAIIVHAMNQTNDFENKSVFYLNHVKFEAGEGNFEL